MMCPGLDQHASTSPDVGTLRSSFATDPDMQEILVDFIGGLPDRVDQLIRLLRAGQLDELRRVTHQVKGAGGGYGFPQITDAAAAAESLLKAGEAIESIAQGVKALVELMRSVEGYDKARETFRATEGSGHR